MSKFSTQIEINVPREKVWQALADIGSIANWNPGVEASHTTSPRQGLGASRHCDLPGKRFLEEDVVEWEEGKVLTMRITESNLPLRRADIRFTLEGREGRTRVTVEPDYQLKFGILGKIMDKLMVRSNYRKGMQGLLQGLKSHLE